MLRYALRFLSENIASNPKDTSLIYPILYLKTQNMVKLKKPVISIGRMG